MRPRIWVDNPFDLHDCMHPLTPTILPLRTFARLYGDQVVAGVTNIPARRNRQPAPAFDVARVAWAAWRYGHAFRTIHRDYPPALRG
jgi:hypothetical protein